MRELKDFTRDELLRLCFILLQEGAEVQAMDVDEFAEMYGVRMV